MMFEDYGRAINNKINEVREMKSTLTGNLYNSINHIDEVMDDGYGTRSGIDVRLKDKLEKSEEAFEQIWQEITDLLYKLNDEYYKVLSVKSNE